VEDSVREEMMKRLLMGLVLMAIANAASAEWTAAGDSDEFIQYVDRATIRRNGNLVKMSSLTDFKTVQKSAAGKSYLSEKQQAEYDCKEKKKRYLAFTWFDGQMGNGKVVVSNGDVRGEWRPIAPGSSGETLWKIACGKL
jgi:hypothetical protein